MAVLRRSARLRYALSLLFVSLALGLRWILDPALGDGLPYASVFAALAAAAWFAGACAMVGYARWFLAGEMIQAARDRAKALEREGK